MVTGYYVPTLKGSRSSTEKYRYPLYRLPKGRKNYSRAAIERGALAELGLELAWVTDPVDLFFLHVQGSGVIELPDGTRMTVNYAGKNGHTYRSIGRYLVKNEIIPEDKISMQSIRRYFEANPDKISKVLNHNPSYVYFKEGSGGAIGALGVPVTPYRSIATDLKLFPRGALALISTKLPRFDAQQRLTGWDNYQSLVFNQDTGGAIKGRGRVDLFTGGGMESGLIAGHLKQSGSLQFLVPKRS